MLMSSCVEGLRFADNQKDSPDSAYSHTYVEIYQPEKIQGKISKGTRTWGGVQWNTGTSFQEFSPCSQRVHSILPALNSDNVCEVLATRETHQKLSAQSFHQKLVTQLLSAQYGPKSRPPEEKRLFSTNHILCSKGLSTVSYTLSFKESFLLDYY